MGYQLVATDFGPTKSNGGMNLRSTGRDAAAGREGDFLARLEVSCFGEHM